MRHFLALLFLAAGISWGQTTPDCQFTVAFSSASPQSPAFNNKPTTSGGQTPCTSWVVTYWTNGASGVSLSLQGAPDSGGSPGSYTALTAVSTSANPATGTAEGNILACCDYYPWIRINPTTFTGTSQTMIVRVYGYRNNNVARGGGGGTLQLTQDVLAGPGTGSLAATVVGINTVPLCSGFTPTNGQFIQYTTAGSPNPCYTAAAASSTLPASIVTYTPGSSVTLTCPSSTLGTVTVFAPGNASPASYTALAANMTISWASCTAGQDIKLAVKQAATGGPYTVPGLPSGAPQISPVASVVTTYTLHAVSATAVAFDNVAADSGPGICTEIAAPGTPGTGLVYFWCDSTGANLQAKNPAGAISGTAFAKTAVANQPLLSFDPTTGAFTQGALTAAAGWTDDGTNITATAGRNVAVGTRLPDGSGGTIISPTLGLSGPGQGFSALYLIPSFQQATEQLQFTTSQDGLRITPIQPPSGNYASPTGYYRDGSLIYDAANNRMLLAHTTCSTVVPNCAASTSFEIAYSPLTVGGFGTWTPLQVVTPGNIGTVAPEWLTAANGTVYLFFHDSAGARVYTVSSFGSGVAATITLGSAASVGGVSSGCYDAMPILSGSTYYYYCSRGTPGFEIDVYSSSFPTTGYALAAGAIYTNYEAPAVVVRPDGLFQIWVWNLGAGGGWYTATSASPTSGWPALTLASSIYNHSTPYLVTQASPIWRSAVAVIANGALVMASTQTQAGKDASASGAVATAVGAGAVAAVAHEITLGTALEFVNVPGVQYLGGYTSQGSLLASTKAVIQGIGGAASTSVPKGCQVITYDPNRSYGVYLCSYNNDGSQAGGTLQLGTIWNGVAQAALNLANGKVGIAGLAGCPAGKTALLSIDENKQLVQGTCVP